MTHTHLELSRTGFQGVPHVEHGHLKIHKLHEKLPTDKSHYLMAAVAEITKGEPVPGHAYGPSVTYIIEGELHVKDESKPGKVTKLVAGDVIHVDDGSQVIMTTPNKAKVFGASYSPSHLQPEDFIVKK